MDDIDSKQNKNTKTLKEAAIQDFQNYKYKIFKNIICAYNTSNNILQNCIIGCNTCTNTYK